MPFDIGTGELVVIALVIVLFFGAKRIPEFGKMIGEGIRSLRGGFKDDPAAAEGDKK